MYVFFCVWCFGWDGVLIVFCGGVVCMFFLVFFHLGFKCIF